MEKGNFRFEGKLKRMVHTFGFLLKEKPPKKKDKREPQVAFRRDTDH